MSSRQQQKEARRAERLEREQKEKAAAGRRRRLQLVLGGVLALAAVAAVVVAVVVGLGGDDNGGEAKAPGTPNSEGVSAPTAKLTDLAQAAKQGECDLKVGLNSEGRGHEEKDFKASDYKTNPPTSGAHFPEWYDDGIYEPGQTPELGKIVHALEHGRVEIQYAAGTPKNVVAQLEALVGENDGYHQLLFQNPTDMPYKLAATAWTQLLGCRSTSPAAFDAIRLFRSKYTDKGPELVP